MVEPSIGKRKHREIEKDDDEIMESNTRLDELFFTSSIEMQQKLALYISIIKLEEFLIDIIILKRLVTHPT